MQEYVLERKLVLTKVALFTAYVAIALAAPLINNQLITGSIVNATLFLAVATLGFREAIFIGLIPSLISLSIGLLPVVLAPMIPFIMMGNAVLMLVFSVTRKKLGAFSYIASALFKFAVIYGASFIVAGLIKNPVVAQKTGLMMGYMQLVTALIGAAIAMAVLNFKAITKTK